MTRLESLLAEARTSLPPTEQEALADLVETFLVTHEAGSLFTEEELEELRRMDGEPDDLADPAEVAAALAGHG